MATVLSRILTAFGKHSNRDHVTDRESDMKTDIKTFEFKHLIVLTAQGTLDLEASRTALRTLVTAPGFEAMSEVLLDLRQVECDLSVDDIHELVSHMAWHMPVLFDDHRIAVLVKSNPPDNMAFNHARFFELCAENRDLHIRAFEDPARAGEWLVGDLRSARFGIGSSQQPSSPFSGRRPQFGLR